MCAKVNDVQIQSVPLTPDFEVVVSEVSSSRFRFRHEVSGNFTCVGPLRLVDVLSI